MGHISKGIWVAERLPLTGSFLFINYSIFRTVQKTKTRVDFQNDSLWERIKDSATVQIIATILVVLFIVSWFYMRKETRARDICSYECRVELGEYGSFFEYNRCVDECIYYWMKPPDM